MTKVISITNQKGGVGKTTTSCNIAKGIVERGYKVLVIDADSQANSTDLIAKIGTKIDEEFEKEVEAGVRDNNFFRALEDALTNSEKITLDLSDVLDKPILINKAIIETDIPNLDLLPSSLRLNRSDKNMRDDYSRSSVDRLKIALQNIVSNYDYVIIDNKPSEDLIITNTLIVSDLVIIPLKTDRGSLKGFLTTIKNMLKIKEQNNSDFDFKILFTMVSRNNNDQRLPRLFEKYIPNMTFKNIIRFQAKPANEGSLTNTYIIDKNTPLSADFKGLVDEILCI